MKHLALLVALAACGDDGGTQLPDAAPAADADLSVDAAPPRETITATQSLQPGELVEGIMTGGPSDLALIHLEAPISELDWNIHGHAGGGTQIIVSELKAMTVDYTFVPNDMADWYLLLRNKGQTDMTVQLTIELFGAMSWSGWQ